MQGKEIITARDVSTACEFPFELYCKYFVSEDKRDPLTEDQKRRFEKGKDFEEEEVNTKYPNRVPLPSISIKDKFRVVLQRMALGEDVIASAPLFYLPDEGMHGIADLLERREGESIFGSHHYIIREIKHTGNIKLKHRLQAAFYTYVIGKIQGRIPDVFIMHGKNDAEEYVYEKHQDDLLEYIRTARRIKLGEYTPPAIYGKGGSWSTYCDDVAEQKMDISLISDVGVKMRSNIMRAGFDTIQSIADTTSKELQKVKGVKSKAPDFIASANAIITNDYVRKEGKIDLPHKSVEMFLDLEGLADDATDTIHDYLIGVLVRQDGKRKYHPFVAENMNERQMLVDFLEFMKGFEDYVIYHWASYEHTYLKKMMERHNVDGYDILDKDVL